MRIRFARLKAAHAFGSMAEGMEEVQRDEGETFVADKMAMLAQTIWDKLEHNPTDSDWPYSIVVDNAAADVARGVLENCHDNVDGREFFPDMDHEEEDGWNDADQCYVNDCEIPADDTTGESIYDYFARKLGVAPNDATFKELPVDSNCGDDCKRAIDAAATLLDADKNAGGDNQETIRRIVFEACEVFWHG